MKRSVLYPHLYIMLAVMLTAAPVTAVENVSPLAQIKNLDCFTPLDDFAFQVKDSARAIQAEVAAGRRPYADGYLAQRYEDDLQVYLTRVERRVDDLENIIMRSEGKNLVAALKELQRQVGERERVMVNTFLALQQLAGNFKLQPEQQPSKPARGGVKAPDNRKQKNQISIEFRGSDDLVDDLE